MRKYEHINLAVYDKIEENDNLENLRYKDLLKRFKN